MNFYKNNDIKTAKEIKPELALDQKRGPHQPTL